MKAVVLVGGMGTRLRPLTLTTPKQMLHVTGVTMIERVLSHLAAHGVEEATLSMGYRPDPFLSAFPSDRCAGVGLRYAVEPAPLDTGGAIRFAALHGELVDTFVVVNGDVLTDLDVTELVALHREREAKATIHVTPVADPRSFGVVSVDGAGRVEAFMEKPEVPSTDLINGGTYVVEPEVVERIAGDRRVSVERETFPAMVEEGSLFALASDAYWLDVGTPAAYLRAQLDLLSGVRPGPPAPGAIEGETGVWTVGRPVVSGEVRPQSLIGDAAYVAKESQVEGSVVSAGARVEGARVVGSVLLPGAVTRAGAVVEGSIVGAGAVVGKGAEVTGLSVVGEGVELDSNARISGARVPSS
ncbi:MAG: NDP-sugar synthase [Actinomycetota bacterium]|nr:NDP-sugar synthase [Actinomycetota bacterium]MDQ3574118.1 NDP-sugar synthase [Actinomycetota bacterium]